MIADHTRSVRIWDGPNPEPADYKITAPCQPVCIATSCVSSALPGLHTLHQQGRSSMTGPLTMSLRLMINKASGLGWAADEGVAHGRHPVFEMNPKASGRYQDQDQDAVSSSTLLLARPARRGRLFQRRVGDRGGADLRDRPGTGCRDAQRSPAPVGDCGASDARLPRHRAHASRLEGIPGLHPRRRPVARTHQPMADCDEHQDREDGISTGTPGFVSQPLDSGASPSCSEHV
jgi:hypothetical protein